MRDITPEICERLAAIRLRRYGPRGRSRFARDLGIGPSTYAHYETDRLPPADILLRAARITQTRLEWLISGEGEFEEASQTASAYARTLAERLLRLLKQRPQLLPRVEAFLNLLDPQRAPGPRGSARPDQLIPIVGSTSAGTARYWRELPGSTDGPVADSQLEELLASCTWPAQHAPAAFSQPDADEPVSLIQLSRPDDRGLLEFLSAPLLKVQHPGCVAWRIDGDSMDPRYLDGDLVITDPEAPAQTGHPCVARQRGQLGVNCKVYQQSGETVWLIPINSRYPTQVVASRDIAWAWRVVGSVRLQRPRGGTP